MPRSDYRFVNQKVYSHDCQFNVRMQGDGNLVAFEDNGAPIWQTHALGNRAWAVLQNDGTFAIYQRDRAPISFHHSGGSHLIMQDDGNLVLYTGSFPVWTSGSVRDPIAFRTIRFLAPTRNS